jgi:YjjG family noncanonical pyrimidine nucleotidase
MPAYQWLFFDADGTLFDFARAEEAALKQSFQRIGADFSADHLAAYRQINHHLWQAFEKGAVAPGEINIRRFELFFATLGLKGSPVTFGEIYLSLLATRNELIDGADDVLKMLGRRHRLAILTNGLQAVQRPRLEGSSIRGHISAIIISEEIGAAKPAAKFFEVAFSRTGNPRKEDVLMIGDNWVSDIHGALEYGIDACWFNPSRLPRPDGRAVTREIASLRELPELLAPIHPSGQPQAQKR